MKLIKMFIIVFLFVSVVSVFNCYAQQQQQQYINRLIQHLNLNADQVRGVNSIVAEAAEKRKEIVEEYNAGTYDLNQMRQQLQLLKEDADSKYEKIFTKEQLIRFDQFRNQQRQMWRSKVEKGLGGQGLNK